MSNAFTSAGTRIYIGDALPATYDKAGFEAVDWTEIGEVTDLGEFGKEFNLVEHNPLGTRRTIKRKGSFNDGAITLQYAYDSNDAGQADLRTALDSDNSFPFKVVLQNNIHIYLSAQVMSAPVNVGSVDQITSASTSLEIDDDILVEDAPGVSTVTVTYLAGANGSIIGNAEQTILSGGDTTAVFAAADGGFVFDEWSDTSTDNPRNDTNVTGDLTVTASFVPE
jgi:hypothetical protein